MTTPADLSIPAEDKAIVAELMEAHGFDQLKETQRYAFENGILEDGNNLLVAETGNGKTLTAEAVVLKHLKQGNRVAYLVPSKQLVWDKKETIEEWAGLDYNIYSGRGKYRSGDVAVATFESFYQAILKGTEGARSLDAIVLDDFHELYSDFRGGAIEVAVSAALYEGMSIFGISATLGNPDELGAWMDAEVLISPEDRQTPIEEHAVDASTSSTKQAILDVVRDNPEKGPFLCFCFAKSWTESRAKALAESDLFDGPPDRDLRTELSEMVDGMLTKTHQEILSMLRGGAAYIHADLPGNIKRYILDLYEEGELAAICTTTSLAYGFDSPVQTVIIADIKRRGNYVGVYEYVQWAGRSARPKFDYEKGYCYTLTDDPNETRERFFDPHRELEPVQTHFDNEEQFRWLVLELIANEWKTTEQIERFLEQTLYWEQMNEDSAWGREPKPKTERLQDRLDEATQWLEDEGFIEEADTWAAFNTTALGRAAVGFHYNSFVDATLTSIKSFYTWAEDTPRDEIIQLDYLYKTATTFDLTLSVNSVDGPMEPVLKEYGYEADKPGITAGLIRWYWMRNKSTEVIEEETGVDPTYIPGFASTLSDTLRGTEHILEAAPNARVPDWLDSLTYRVKKGIREDATPLVAEVDAMGRARVRFLRGYLSQMARQTLDTEPDAPLGRLLADFYRHTGSAEKFQTVLKDQVTMVGNVSAKNLAEFADEHDPEQRNLSTEEETALASPVAKAQTPETTTPSLPDATQPTSLTDF